MAELGELLQQARAYKGVSLREAERATRISRLYLEALEAEDLSQLPPDAYARGIARNYAIYLGLDPKTVISLYEQASGQEQPKHEIVPAITNLNVRSHWAPNFAIIAFMVVISAIVFAWMYSAYFQRSEAVATRTIGFATVTPVATSILTITTETSQGGGSSTVTPTIQIPPTATPAPVEEPTDTPSEDTGVAEAATTAPNADCASEPITIGEGSHAFVLWALADVWIDATVDDAPAFSDVALNGCQLIFYGETISVQSGNAQLVQVWVDGVDYGDLGDSWMLHSSIRR